MADLDGFDDVFDSRDVIERIEELENEETWDRDERDEHAELVRFRDEECSHFSEWNDGVTFIHDNYFTDYAKEYASDIGAISGDVTWPLDHIDWEEAASDLQSDFTSVTFHRQTYWARS